MDVKARGKIVLTSCASASIGRGIAAAQTADGVKKTVISAACQDAITLNIYAPRRLTDALPDHLVKRKFGWIQWPAISPVSFFMLMAVCVGGHFDQ